MILLLYKFILTFKLTVHSRKPWRRLQASWSKYNMQLY